VQHFNRFEFNRKLVTNNV